MKKYSTVIWDLDGTLLDTLTDLKNAVNVALNKFGYPERSLEEIRTFVGKGVRNLMARSVPGGAEDPNFDAAFAAFEEYYSEHNKDNTRPYKGVTEVIKKLSSLGVKQAIVSNKIDSAVRLLNAEFFGVDTAIGDQEGLARKPYPDMVNKAIEILGAEKKDTVYIGDSEVDIQTAENSGLDCISVLWGFRTAEELAPYKPMCTVENPDSILDYILT